MKLKYLRRFMCAGLFIVCCLRFMICFASSIADKFSNENMLYYKVYYNAISVGAIEWRYLGQKIVDGKSLEILAVKSDTSILQVFDMKGDERIYLDSQTLLPVKVERDLLVFGKKEIISEIYDQERGTVKVFKNDTKEEKKLFKPGKPIQNITALLYFFPDEIDLKKIRAYSFNLPTRTVRIQICPPRILKQAGKKNECYFIIGKAQQKFKIWLDKNTRLPLRIEFISLAGKISIVRQSAP